MKRVRSVNRIEAREAEKKLTPAIKAISSHVNNTTEIASVFKGYKLPAGEVEDKRGRKWQYQIHAVVSKGDFIKRDEVQPIIAKGAILFRLRIFLKALIDSVFN